MSGLVNLVKHVLPGGSYFLPILRGPLRGGVFYSNPRVSMRKVFGLYEAELNPWLNLALRKADIVVDVGANDGYFTFGCAAAMRRHNREVKVLSFEPSNTHVSQLEVARDRGGYTKQEIEIVPMKVGRVGEEATVALDQFVDKLAPTSRPLIKIDVEGAELAVLEGASGWLSDRAMILIEVHKREYLQEIRSRLLGVVDPFVQVDQKPLPILGRERRDENNWWLLSPAAFAAPDTSNN